ncbi:HPr(Ser) kinase/phosphatase [Deltaproteobacteria bacterium PRO3]|nr:HPr(Ser) kinase/phosphatase [Deltaproteobacteria bacterium PRO3]
MISIQVAELIKDSEYHLNLELVAGKQGLLKKITIPRIQKPGLALTGDTSNLHSGRLQVLGKSEISYLNGLPEKKLRSVVEKICKIDLSAMVITRGNPVPDILVEEAEKNSIPLFSTNLLTSTFINRITKFLEDKLTASTNVHGVLMDVFGVGIMIIGKSGIGKSEAALDLILRGHRLVADDVVEIKKKPPSTLSGMSSEIIKYHMEIRGLGIINIEDLFGVAAIRDRKVIDIVVELVDWDPKAEYDRLGMEEQTYPILDVRVPYLKIPVRPGRNVTTIIEVAARNHLLKQRGHFSAQEFDEKLSQDLQARDKLNKTLWNSLE